MQCQEVITQLQTVLPQLTGAFTDDVGVTSVTRAATVLTVECAGVHGGAINDIVSLVGAITPIGVTSITRVGTLLTVETTTPHDLVFRPGVDPPLVFAIEGANEPEFNVDHTVGEVLNRTTLTVDVADSGATTGTGTMTILGVEAELQGYNLPYRIQSVPTTTSFTINHPGTALMDPVGTITARIGPRVSGGIAIDRMISAYTAQNVQDYWLQVILEDVNASRDLQSRGDATVNRNLSTHMRQQILNPFSVFLFIPASDDLSARGARDAAEGMFGTICRSLLGKRFGSGLTDTEQGSTGFESHGSQAYTGSVYVHRYSFVQVVDLSFGDTVGPPSSIAFRDIDFTLTPSTGSDTLSTIGIDLDQSP